MDDSPGYSLTNYERVAAVFAVTTAPFWFVQPLGFHFTPSDFTFALLAVSVGLRNRIYPFPENRYYQLGSILFIGMSGISLLYTTLPLEGIQFFFQYFFIFFIVIPFGIYVFNDRTVRRYSLYGIFSSLNFISLYAFYISVTTHINKINLTLWYGNQNQLYWLTASAVLINACLLLSGDIRRKWKVVLLPLLAPALHVTITGLTVTAIVTVAVGLWLIVGYWAYVERGERTRHLYVFTTLVAAAAGILGIVAFWDRIYVLGSLEIRIPHYLSAIERSVEQFPLGGGLGSSYDLLGHRTRLRSVHNFVLAYLLELGPIGVIGFTLVLLSWVLVTLVGVVRRQYKTEILYFGPTAVFAAYAVVLLFQPVPLRRYWWIMFSLSYAAVEYR